MSTDQTNKESIGEEKPEFKITADLVEKINVILSAGLTKGKGDPEPGKMCVEAAICYALGEPHTDNPSCVGSEVRRAKINLNDCNWSSDSARAKGMKYLAVAQLGSNVINQDEFSQQLKLNSSKRILPFLIQKHYNSLNEKDEKLLEYKAKFEQLTKLDNNLLKEFYSYCSYYYIYCYSYYYHYHYYYNYYYINNHYYHYNFGDEFLLLIADVILQTLKELKSPGCEWLHLVK